MQPSSLIFLVIIAVWAAYFVQYWVRRREHLATAQSVDQFSETMRVLERRSPLPATDLSTPARPSYAVSPARAVRAQVLVKRAETTTFTMTPSGAVTPVADAVPDSPRRSGGWDASVDTDDEGQGWDVEAAPVVRPARAVRGLTLLAALAGFVLSVPLAALGVVPWFGILVPLAAAAGAVVWLRQAVATEQAARRDARRPSAELRSQRSESSAHRRDQGLQRSGRPAPREHAAPTARAAGPDAEHASEEAEPVAESVAAPVRDELYDVQEVERGLAAPAAVATRSPAARGAAAPAAAAPRMPLVDEDDIPLTWDPVPVPRPTYTMKSRATRPAPTSADLVGDADTEFARYEQEPVRRVAGA
ncbi:hypothetical protein [Phycicoccus sp. Root101]|uniref:hypothetical protein n=1 Tax=Phycicoccus sp. Root101 TaxID=1736421 RepID=UPI0012F7500D|nr:hypothetical protein [Phycicoccus sp. Root101]